MFHYSSILDFLTIPLRRGTKRRPPRGTQARVPKLSAKEIAEQCLYDPDHFDIQLSQTQHRVSLVYKWPIFEGAKILELGCGQGDCTAVLAAAVGPNGHVTGVDPARLAYGWPFTVEQARKHLSAGKYGSRIAWVQDDPIHFLESNKSATYDIAVLAHCVWYFANPQIIIDTLSLLSTRVRYICVAEWSLSSGSLGVYSTPHLLSVFSQAAVACRKPATEANVRTMVSPERIKEMAEEVGLRVMSKSEGSVTPMKDLLDGKWEVDITTGEDFLDEVDEYVKEEREKAAVLAMRDAVKASLNVIGGRKNVRSMEVWCATFELGYKSE